MNCNHTDDEPKLAGSIRLCDRCRRAKVLAAAKHALTFNNNHICFPSPNPLHHAQSNIDN